MTLPGALKSIQLEKKKPKLQQINYLTATSCDLECQGKSSMIKDVSSRTSYSISCLDHATSVYFTPNYTIPSAMASGADEPINHLNVENFRKY